MIRRPLREGRTWLTGTIALVILLAVLGGALNFQRIFSGATRYHAELANADQLVAGEPVTIAGVKVGKIDGLKLRGDQVELTFEMGAGNRVGSMTTLQVKVLSPLGQEYVQLVPKGPGRLQPGASIPRSRTFVTPTLLDTITQLGGETGQINEQQLEQALNTVSSDFSGATPAATASAISGLGAVSQVISGYQSQLAQLVTQANQVTAVVQAHDQPLVQLIGQSNLVLTVVQQRKAAIDQLFSSITSLSQQVSSLLTDPSANLSALIQNLDTVSAAMARDSSTFGQTLPLLAGFSKYAANASGSGPFLDADVPEIFISGNVVTDCSKPGAITDSNVLTGPGCKG